MPTIDTHAHVFHRGLKLAPGRRYAPDYDAPLALYLEQIDRNGMSNGALVQPSFLGTDNSYLVESLKTAGGRLRGIAVVDPSVTADELRALDRAGVVGIRLNLVGQPLPDLAAGEWKALLGNVKSMGWQVELQRSASDLALLAPQLLDHGVTVVLDHYALPDPKLGVADPGFQSVLKLGATKNVWVKISAPYRNGTAGESFAKETYPLLRSAYGLDRLLWGSDWPHTQFEASQSYERNRQFLDTLITDPAERAQVLVSPRSLFRF
ncbi:amidohydrolase [Bradyrhizobium liaoningense]|uniref:amidohydrolase family protein n=1 Tax=Bradyrhizobium liaoningense TaxID=43992 RepID=UPI002011EF41|nr:amidohydrolase family protein [Bradyrhizobium liaoningense]MCP1742887.1 putative TIM-barrel fold metal-dependent hydrolase [Bradyrhizobium japonicum]MCP1781242.1 putative TIM-barrel fold metal-dependent hydrolase [Bradyrhizobium japonicum]MCP1860598.1 putative TIM-barrel fold metal-dependent hydrolase [Bradyrhizobium japonicum]MCP1891361.1 putative TIM-barrel fold metal-dependent hydrolase [Bradyrhizobium japonicum]MCP1955767.1 putative TIM-barrel fold metal-dependent hydrolase [Bradyrhizob